MHEKNISIRQAEEEILGLDHTQIGELLGKKWNFPWNILEPIAFHHSPQEAKHEPIMVAIVHLGNAIAKLEGLGNSGDNQPPHINPTCWEMLQIPEDELGKLIMKIHEEFEDSSGFLNLN